MEPKRRAALGLLLLCTATTVVLGGSSTMECFTQKGPPYNGTLNRTANGEPCLPWSEFVHLKLRKSWNATVMKEQSNYCRNPDDDPRGPWCMFTRAKYGTCAIPHCEHLEDCYNDDGSNYLGDANIAETGEPCFPWAKALRVQESNDYREQFQIRELTSVNTSRYVSIYGSRVEDFNSCRNPSGLADSPWCYVVNNGMMTKRGCDVKKCDHSSHLGFPLDFADQCPPGFAMQVGETTSNGQDITTIYCVLTSVGLMEIETSRFKNFCLFLLNQNRETCPKGFEMKRTFMRTKLQSSGQLSIFRKDSGASIWLTLCCTNGSHVDTRTKYPIYDIVNKKTSNSKIPRPALRPWLESPTLADLSLPSLFESPRPRRKRTYWKRSKPNVSMKTSLSIPQYSASSKDVLVFASIEKCPAVDGTRRKIFTMGTWKATNLTATLLQYGYYTSICLYYDDPGNEASYKGQRIEKLIPSILVEGKQCPLHFSPAPVFEMQHLFTYLRTAFILCRPTGIYRDYDLDSLLPQGTQCFISHPSSQTVQKDVLYECPDRFEKNELRWSDKNATNSLYTEVSLLFCCRTSPNDEAGMTKTPTSRRAPTTGRSSSFFPLSSSSSRANAAGAPKTPARKQYSLPVYLRKVPTFATLMLGSSCPEYLDDEKKLSADFIPVMQTESFLTLELIGQNNPVDFIDFITGVRGVLSLCKYSQQREDIGIVSVNGICEGVGDRKVSTVVAFRDAGATCAVNVTGITFPAGSYCFYKISKVCPSGLPELQMNIFEGLMKSFMLQTMISPTSVLNEEKELCCQTEESLGAVKLPLNITAAFALPAFQSMCQSFIGFTVDQTKGLCEYTPITEQPTSVIVWPRRVFPNNLRGKTEIALTCSDEETLHSVRMARNFMMRYRNIWLSPSPMQDFSSHDAMELCFATLQGSLVPSRSVGGHMLDYCLVVFAICPNDDFEMVAVFPSQQYIICCTKQTPNLPETTTNISGSQMWPDSLRSIVTLGRKRSGDEEKVKDLSGPTELHRDLQQPKTEDGCPAFVGFSLIRRYVKMWRPRRYRNLWVQHTIQQLLNISASTESMRNPEAIGNKTGMWLQDGQLHVIFCEYHTLRPADPNQKTVWPVENYAIPKPITGCPPGFKTTEFVHLQGRNGFHYSQPIHLAGDFIAHSRAVKLQYCKRQAALPWVKRYASPLPPGHYCLLLVGRRCPSGFTAGSLSMLEGLLQANETDSNGAFDVPMNLTQGPTDLINSPRIFRDTMEKGGTGLTFDRVTYMFCCRADSPSASISISGFPSSTGPFYLYRAGETCQEIAGLRATEEFICMDAPEFLVGKVLPFSFHMEIVDKTHHIEGFTPTLSLSSDHCNVKINLCYYEPNIDDAGSDDIDEEQNIGFAWPEGSYSLLTTIRGPSPTACPPGFILDVRPNIRQDVIANTFFRPMSFSEYFVQMNPSDSAFLNGSMSSLMTCKRNVTDDPAAYNLTSFHAWPPGNYCVLMDLDTRSCPPGLHRYTRQLAELCCHTEMTNPTTPVKLAFDGDFFLMGAFDEPDLTCLPIENTHVEKYVILLFSAIEPHIHSLCHYLPLAWLNKTRLWPPGDYLLPIGKRGVHLPTLNPSSEENEVATEPPHRVKFSCPAGFHRIIHEYEMFDEQFGEGSDLDSDGSGTTVTLHYCQHEKEDVQPETRKANKNNSWPKGDYCVIVVGAICPPEMRSENDLVMRVPRSYLKSIRKANDYGEPEGENLYSGDVGSRNVTYYSVCCREDKMLLVDLPSFSGGMYMPAGSRLCSSIPGTFIEHEQMTTYLHPTLLEPYLGGLFGSLTSIERRLMPAPFEKPGIMTLCYYHQMKQISQDGKTTSSGNMLHDLLEPGTTALSLWLAGECGCAENAYCRPFKRFSCKCKNGTFGDGIRVCRKVTPLTDPCANLCHKSAECRVRPRHSFISRIEETACVCNEGFVGDGFHCLPQCSVKTCQPYSRCKIKKGVPTCECVPGTIEDGDRCNFDIYSSLQAEKDFPQYMLQHLTCFDDTVTRALIKQEPNLFFVLFAPLELLKTCTEIRSHIVTFPDEEAYVKFQKATFIKLTNLNGSLIFFNSTHDVIVNGVYTIGPPILFTNGRVYYINDKLKHIEICVLRNGKMTAIVISLLVIVLLATLIGGAIFVKRRYPNALDCDRLVRRPHFQRLSASHATWSGSTGVLVASDELNND